MNPQLTERLICPRCGPRFGLVLRADQVEEGSVVDGFLGCSNCRVLYPVARGVADLRHPPRSRTHRRARAVPPPTADASAPETLRLAALIGVARGPALIAVAGNLAGRASGLASLLPDVEVVALAPRFDFRPPGGASWLMASQRLPLRDGSLAGIALAGSWAEPLLDDAARCLAPAGRIVLLGASADGEQAFRSRDLKVLASKEGVLVGRLD
ncbi:MAG: hypothetical protein OXE73_07145 [Gammaproteobacteria bacterium]|nr:hypothetical protein [Gammaproteobacteria bacterium]